MKTTVSRQERLTDFFAETGNLTVVVNNLDKSAPSSVTGTKPEKKFDLFAQAFGRGGVDEMFSDAGKQGIRVGNSTSWHQGEKQNYGNSRRYRNYNNS